MGYRRTPLAVDEWYHCYTRGIDQRSTFEDTGDFERFRELLYLANDVKAVDRNLYGNLLHKDVFIRQRVRPLVSIGAYCLMPNHYHILLKEIEEGGISKFMQKVGTGYVMYFNTKNERVGNLFIKPFRSKHIGTDRYLRHVAQYIHLNPAELFERDWKRGIVRNRRSLERLLMTYRFSSFPDFSGAKRAQGTILDREAFQLLKDGLPPLTKILKEAAEYYGELYTTGNSARMDAR